MLHTTRASTHVTLTSHATFFRITKQTTLHVQPSLLDLNLLLLNCFQGVLLVRRHFLLQLLVLSQKFGMFFALLRVTTRRFILGQLRKHVKIKTKAVETRNGKPQKKTCCLPCSCIRPLGSSMKARFDRRHQRCCRWIWQLATVSAAPLCRRSLSA